MRIRAVFVHGGDRGAGCDHAGITDAGQNELLQSVLRQTLTFADSFADAIERLIDDAS